MSLPQHVALIMDGNRRAGEADLGDKLKGHIQGVERAEEIVRAAAQRKIPYLTLYAFSTENWKRSSEEVEVLFGLFRSFFDTQINALIQEGVSLRVIGRRDRLPSDIVSRIVDSEARSKEGTTLTLLIALDYGGRDELVRAAQSLALRDEVLDEVSLNNALDTVGVPDPDLIVRTGGEQRLSGFLPWQSAYAELSFTDTLWPHFTEAEFEKALAWYETRNRRLGQ